MTDKGQPIAAGNMETDRKTVGEKVVLLAWRIGGIGMIVLSSFGILCSLLMFLAAILGSADDRAGYVLEGVGAGAGSAVFLYLGIRLASATRRDLHLD